VHAAPPQFAAPEPEAAVAPEPAAPAPEPPPGAPPQSKVAPIILIPCIAGTALMAIAFGGWPALGFNPPSEYDPSQWGPLGLVLGRLALLLAATAVLSHLFEPPKSLSAGQPMGRLLWWPLRFLVGSTLLALALFAVAVAPAAADSLPVRARMVNLAFAGLWGLMVLLQALLRRLGRSAVPAPSVSPVRMCPLDWVVAGVLLLALCAALSPAVESDGLRYHLVAPQEWARNGRITYIPFNAFTNLPAQLGLLSLASPWDYRFFQAVHWMHLVCAVLLVGEIARACVRGTGEEGQRAASLGRLLACGMPVLVIVGAWPFSDVASAAMVLGIVALACAPAFPDERGLWRVMWMAFLAGGAVATKVASVPAAGIALAFGWCVCAARTRTPVLFVGVSVLVMLVAGIAPLWPWIVKNVFHTGNPAYPLLWERFGGGEWSLANQEFYLAKAAEKGIPKTLLNLLASPLHVSIRWVGFEGHNPGPAFLGTVAAAVYGACSPGRSRPQAAATALALVLWAAWFFGYQSVRFAMVPLALFAAAAAAGLSRGHMPALPRHALAAVALVGVAWSLSWWVRPGAAPALSVAVARDPVVVSRFSGYPAVMWLNRNVFPGDKVFYIGEHRGAYATRFTPLHSDWFDTPRVLAEIRATDSTSELLDRWRSSGIRWVLVNYRELGLYEEMYFRPRFTAEEWKRYRDLIATLRRSRAWGDQTLWVTELELREPETPEEIFRRKPLELYRWAGWKAGASGPPHAEVPPLQPTGGV
jgi:hypothetical protein